MKDFHAFPPMPPLFFFFGLLIVFFASVSQVLMLRG